jgi:hypothetical protein
VVKNPNQRSSTNAQLDIIEKIYALNIEFMVFDRIRPHCAI